MAFPRCHCWGFTLDGRTQLHRGGWSVCTTCPLGQIVSFSFGVHLIFSFILELFCANTGDFFVLISVFVVLLTFGTGSVCFW